MVALTEGEIRRFDKKAEKAAKPKKIKKSQKLE
ncbi:MAG: hypothetical protein ACI9NT_002135 [Bacteroidia bacterium]|jgi:hypothetical protein